MAIVAAILDFGSDIFLGCFVRLVALVLVSKFQVDLMSGSGEEVENVNCLRTDGRRTDGRTTDGRRTPGHDISSADFVSRAKNEVQCCISRTISDINKGQNSQKLSLLLLLWILDKIIMIIMLILLK